MKRKLFFLLTATVLLFCTTCSGSFTDPGMLDQLGGGIGLGDDDDFWKGGNDNGSNGGNTSDLSAPKGVKAKAISSSSIEISWNAVSRAFRYNVYRSKSSSGTYEVIYSGYSTSYLDTELSSKTTYYYKISASTLFGEESALSSSVFARTK